MRITGLATGMDIDKTVQDMLKPQRARVDKSKQEIQALEWKQEIYRDVIKDVRELKTKYFDVLNKDKYLLSSSSYYGNKVEKTGISADVIAKGNVKEGEYEINVIELAKTANIKGDSSDASMSTELSSLGINGGTLKINNKEIKIDGDIKTVRDLSNAISKGTENKVKLSYSELTKSFTLETKETGESVSLTIEDKNSEDLLKKLKINVTAGNTIKGSNAKVEIKEPGMDKGILVTDKESNKFTLDGLNYDLKTKGKTNFVASKNTDKTVDLIKSFVEDYNKLVDKTDKLTKTKKNYKYKPLTEEQKKDMKEDDIKKWEEKCKEGIVKGDPYIQDMMRSLRTELLKGEDYKDFNTSLQKIGISTQPYSTNGKLVIDEKKLRDALENNSEDVVQLFTGKKDKEGNTIKDGVFERINKKLDVYVGTTLNKNGHRGLLLEKAGMKGNYTDKKNIFTKSILDKEKLMKQQIDKMNKMENQYYLKFSKLEQAMNKLNSQMSWLSSQVGGQ